jgi:hypothetical protein
MIGWMAALVQHVFDHLKSRRLEDAEADLIYAVGSSTRS